MTMKIHTFWTPVPELNTLDEFRLLLLWRENWAKAGFEPVVLNEYIARRHPFFAEMDAAVSKFPTVNPPAYERGCMIRHLAMAQVGGGILCDHDVFNRSCTPDQAKDIDMDVITIYQRGANGVLVPCLTSGGPEAYLALCKRFASYVPMQDDVEGGKGHCSDQSILQKLIAETPEQFKCTPIVTGYNELGWETAKAIHFSNGNCTPAGRTPRYVHVPQLLP